MKVAATCLAWSMVTWQGAVPVQAPDQPVNLDPGSGVAVSLTRVSTWNLASQVPPQLMPEGLEVTVPWALPAADLATDSRLVVGGGSMMVELTAWIT